jgi:hypothetical protein
MRAHSKHTLLGVLLAAALLLTFSGPAAGMKYMGLKEAIKHFLPKDAKLTKVTKTIPAGELAKLKKRFDLQDGGDFKDKLTAGPHEIYVGKDASGNAQVYVMVLDQYWRTCYHKYAVGLDASGKIKEMVVMEFNCRYQYPINKKSFLKQFSGKKAAKGKAVPVHINKDIDIVTGATASCDATAMIARKALALYEAFFAN